MEYVDILMERSKMVENWRSYLAKIVEAVNEILPNPRVYVFGSAVKGCAVGGSDVDVLIVSNGIPNGNIERAKVKVRIEELSKLPPYHPFELHLADEKEGIWYFSKIKELKEFH